MKVWKGSFVLKKQFCARHFSTWVKKGIWDSPFKCSCDVKSKTPTYSNCISDPNKYGQQADRKLEKSLTIHIWITKRKQTKVASKK